MLFAAKDAIDLLKYSAFPSHGVERQKDGFTVHQPWAGLELEVLNLSSGWYCLHMESCDGAVCLQLTSIQDHTLVELSARDNTPAYVRLEGGRYKAVLFAGLRPGFYPVTKLTLVTLPLLQRMVLFGQRGLAALRAGAGPTSLVRAAYRALRPKGTFGIRAQADNPCKSGPITTADYQRVAAGRHHFPTPVSGGPTFLVRTPQGGKTVRGLETQIYRQFVQDGDLQHDVVCYVGQDQELTPDALDSFARVFLAQPKVSVVIADTWFEKSPTTHVAFDPLLYHNGYPTPFAMRTGFSPKGSWAELQSQHAATGVPIAYNRSSSNPSNISVASGIKTTRPPATVIIPTRDRADLLRRALNGLFEATDWPHDVIVVDNGSKDTQTFALLNDYRDRGLKVIRVDLPFNFSLLCNVGAQAATNDYLVFMNNDVELLGPHWLGHMMQLAMQDNIGAVGGRLYYADKRLQHGGVALGLTQICGHLWRGLSAIEQENVDRLRHDSLRAAVTGALLCVARNRFNAVGGFDEAAFPVTLNDIDLCLKMHAKGWFSAYAAKAEALHAEGESRGLDQTEDKRLRRCNELDIFAARWPGMITNDPWLPAAIRRSTERFGLR